MQTISYTEARNNLKTLLDQVSEDVSPIIITRRNDDDAVVMSLDYYNGLMETIHLMRSPANVEHLNRSIEQYRLGVTQQSDLIDE
ncbi:type II toxin-antitoxin system Phd/YefM family antitoxin [Suttonella ornithocola]|uniref:Antitoxin n=1 Tax=Suttonella ornithocola TaxID=279832 RepID=A0A380MWQ6_9GAMM|nr:type II toxin-antitoxin system prevent-host-death family antitoxin [Suttonella ornithocola]SUO96702.1 Antitoxin YefM [Suttonella ornithocola]